MASDEEDDEDDGAHDARARRASDAFMTLAHGSSSARPPSAPLTPGSSELGASAAQDSSGSISSSTEDDAISSPRHTPYSEQLMCVSSSSSP